MIALKNHKENVSCMLNAECIRGSNKAYGGPNLLKDTCISATPTVPSTPYYVRPGVPEIGSKKPAEKRTKVILRRGDRHLAVNLSDIVCFYYESKLVFALLKDATKYIAELNLAQLEDTLDHGVFFRANRKCIINGDFVKSFRPYNKIKIQVEMDLPAKAYTVVVSQKRAARFRKWVYEL